MADVVERYRIVGENAVGAAFRQILKESKTTADRMESVFRTAFAGVSIASIAAVTKQAVDRADAISTLAESFGTTADELSRLDYVARQSNTSLDEITSGLTAFQKNLVLAGEDSGRARKAIAALGISAKDLATLPLPQQLEQIARAFESVHNPTERVRIAAQLFGDDVGRRLLPVLNRGVEGIRALGLESDRLGNTLTREAIEKLKIADEALKRFEASSNSLKTSLAVGLVPAMEALAKVSARVFNPSPDMAVSLFEDAIVRMEQRARLLGISLEEALVPGSEVSRLVAGIRSRIDQMRGNTGPSNPRGGIFKDEIEGAEITQEQLDKLKPVVVTATKIMDDFGAMLRNTATEAQRAAREYELLRIQLDSLLDAGLISSAEYNKRLQEFLDKSIPEVEVTAKKIDENVKQIDKLSTYAEQAARNIQSHFADFLFDPFDKGIKGMLRGFVDVLRRMIAEAAAARILEGLEGKMTGILGGLFGGSGGSGGGGLGGLFGGSGGGGGGGLRLPPGTIPTVPGFARGGYMRPGELGIVGEDGPEYAIAGRRGATIIPASSAQARVVRIDFRPHYEFHIDSRTDRAAFQGDMERWGAEVSDNTVARLTELIRGGAFA